MRQGHMKEKSCSSVVVQEWSWTPEMYCTYLFSRNGSLTNTKRRRDTFSCCCDSNLFLPEPGLISRPNRTHQQSSDTVGEVIIGSGQFSSGSSPSLSTHSCVQTRPRHSFYSSLASGSGKEEPASQRTKYLICESSVSVCVHVHWLRLV